MVRIISFKIEKKLNKFLFVGIAADMSDIQQQNIENTESNVQQITSTEVCSTEPNVINVQQTYDQQLIDSQNATENEQLQNNEVSGATVTISIPSSNIYAVKTITIQCHFKKRIILHSILYLQCHQNYVPEQNLQPNQSYENVVYNQQMQNQTEQQFITQNQASQMSSLSQPQQEISIQQPITTATHQILQIGSIQQNVIHSQPTLQTTQSVLQAQTQLTSAQIQNQTQVQTQSLTQPIQVAPSISAQPVIISFKSFYYVINRASSN